MEYFSFPTEIESIWKQLPLLLGDTFGQQVELIDFKVDLQRPDYLVISAILDHPSLPVIVKLAGPQAEHVQPFERTAAFTQLVKNRTALPMPDVLALDTSLSRWPWRYLIRTYIPGQPWGVIRETLSPEEQADAYRQIGAAVAQLHSARLPAFGELGDDGNLIEALEFLPAFRQHSQRVIRNPGLRELFLTVIEVHQNLFGEVQDPCLSHEDLNQHNVLFHCQNGRWRLATILDMERCWAGHNEMDLARLEFWNGMTHPAFWKSYQESHTLNGEYPQRRQIYQLLWCFEGADPEDPAPPGARQLCADLDIPLG